MVHQGEQAQRFAFRVAEGLRDAGFAVQLHCGGGSFKTQMKRADASGATLAATPPCSRHSASRRSIPMAKPQAGWGLPPNWATSPS
ncbi:MAG TPA: His/Gly/Thr/Pro-type tRNA ligase C-terminal domain-containing protein [Rhodocyclaceae bacterium]|nr:His/Gly/Thr/Pro-type tRNA ligase C-terminal domain-containing protein [Rhodocyclaceae bacterium]